MAHNLRVRKTAELLDPAIIAAELRNEDKIKPRCQSNSSKFRNGDDGAAQGKKRHRQNSDGKEETQKKQVQSNCKSREIETDVGTLARRQKQIDYGKNTIGYDSYRQEVPLENRTSEDPRTPDKYTKYSRRAWDAMIQTWRKQLHRYDPVGDVSQEDVNQEDFVED